MGIACTRAPKGTKITYLQWEPPEATSLKSRLFGVRWPWNCLIRHDAARHASELQAAIRQEAQTPLAVLAQVRSKAIQDLHKLRLASKTEEFRLCETFDRQVASVTKSKQSLILQQLLDRTNTQILIG